MYVMNCKELISIFSKVGGKFECNYSTQKCKILNNLNTLKCDMSLEKYDVLSLLVTNIINNSKPSDFQNNAHHLSIEHNINDTFPLSDNLHLYRNTNGFCVSYTIYKN